MNFFAFVLRRAARHWHILLTLSLGVFISTALLATSPLLVNTVVEFGLRRALLVADPTDVHLRLKTFSRLSAEKYAALNNDTQSTVDQYLGEYTNHIVPAQGSRWLHPWVEGELVVDQRVQFLELGAAETAVRERIILVAGEWPEDPLPEENVAAVVIGEEMATAYRLEIGDRLPVSINRDDSSSIADIMISGIARPQDPQDPYWFGPFSPFESLSDARWLAQYSALIPTGSFFPVIEALFPTSSTHEFSWQVTLAPEKINNDDIPRLIGLINLLRDRIQDISLSLSMDTEIETILLDFADQSTAVRAPLYFLTAEVVLLTLYYVIMVSALSVKQVEREFAILQSRGASVRQILRIQAIEALLISLTAFVSGPLLALVFVRALTIAGPLADVSEPDWVINLPALAWIAAGAGALACMIGLLLPVRAAIQRSIVSYVQSSTRETRRPFWQRAYLDVFLVAIGLLLLWRLQYYGSIVGGSTSRPQVDWLLLLSPIALLIGSGTILLRLFPLLLRFLAALTFRGRGFVANLAMLQAARNPTHVARLVLLLTLAISLGILTTGINATLDVSEEERARYATGSDIHLFSDRALINADVDKLSGVKTSSGMWRGSGSLSVGRNYIRFETLAINPNSFTPLISYREDFAPQPLPEMIALLDTATTVGLPRIELPGEPSRMGVWIWAAPDSEDTPPFLIAQGESNLERIGLEAKIQTARGDIFTFPLISNETGYPEDGWRYFEAVLPSLSTASYPLELHSLWFRNRSKRGGNFAQSIGQSMRLAMDALTVVDRQSQETIIVNEMEELTRLWQLTVPYQGQFTSNAPHKVFYSTEAVYSGTAAQRLNFEFSSLELVGLHLASGSNDPLVLPALVSPDFLAQTEAQIGDLLDVSIDSEPARIEIVGQVTFFPTLYEDLSGGFIVTNQKMLLAQANAITNRSLNSNEAILEIEAGSDPEAVSGAALTNIITLKDAEAYETIRRTIKADPMGLGLRSVTYFGYLLTTVLSLVGFATHFYLSARQKEAIYGVLRSIGLSPQQLYGTLVLEQVILILVGLAIGTGLGVILNQITLPDLPITFSERPPTPPFMAQNDWGGVIQIYVILAVAFLVSLGIATFLLWRTRLHRVLRVGEE